MTLKPGYKRLADLDRERQLIEEKRHLAELNGADANQLGQIDDAIGRVREAIARAAVAEANREANAAADEAARLEQGRPQKPEPARRSPSDPDPDPDPKPNPEPGPDDDDDDSNGGGGGGGGGGGAGISVGLPSAPSARGDAVDIPPGQCIYVRSEDTVWAWSRYTQSWKQQDFASPILSVETVGGGVLVIARHGACIFDAALCEWLTALQTPEILVTGAATGTVPGITVTPPPAASDPGRSPAATSDLPPLPMPGHAEGNQPPNYPLANVPIPPSPELNPGLMIDPAPAPIFPPAPQPPPGVPPSPGAPGFGGTPPGP